MIGTKWWRRSHALSIPAFALALVHGLMAGSDTKRPAVWWMYVFTACVVLFLLLVRAFTAEERRKHAFELAEAEKAPQPVKVKRRLSPFAVRPTPVEMVVEQPAAAPPMFRIGDPESDPRESDPHESDPWEATDNAYPVVATFGAEGREHTNGNGHAAAVGGNRVRGLGEPGLRARARHRRGHAPTPRPKNRSPDEPGF